MLKVTSFVYSRSMKVALSKDLGLFARLNCRYLNSKIPTERVSTTPPKVRIMGLSYLTGPFFINGNSVPENYQLQINANIHIFSLAIKLVH